MGVAAVAAVAGLPFALRLAWTTGGFPLEPSCKLTGLDSGFDIGGLYFFLGGGGGGSGAGRGAFCATGGLPFSPNCIEPDGLPSYPLFTSTFCDARSDTTILSSLGEAGEVGHFSLAWLVCRCAHPGPWQAALPALACRCMNCPQARTFAVLTFFTSLL
jgi:hypothetical protein